MCVDLVSDKLTRCSSGCFMVPAVAADSGFQEDQREPSPFTKKTKRVFRK